MRIMKRLQYLFTFYITSAIQQNVRFVECPFPLLHQEFLEPKCPEHDLRLMRERLEFLQCGVFFPCNYRDFRISRRETEAS